MSSAGYTDRSRAKVGGRSSGISEAGPQFSRSVNAITYTIYITFTIENEAAKVLPTDPSKSNGTSNTDITLDTDPPPRTPLHPEFCAEIWSLLHGQGHLVLLNTTKSAATLAYPFIIDKNCFTEKRCDSGWSQHFSGGYLPGRARPLRIGRRSRWTHPPTCWSAPRRTHSCRSPSIAAPASADDPAIKPSQTLTTQRLLHSLLHFTGQILVMLEVLLTYCEYVRFLLWGVVLGYGGLYGDAGLAAHGVVPVCEAHVARRDDQQRAWFVLEQHSSQQHQLKQVPKLTCLDQQRYSQSRRLLSYGLFPKKATRRNDPPPRDRSPIDSFKDGMVERWNSTSQTMERPRTVRPAAL